MTLKLTLPACVDIFIHDVGDRETLVVYGDMLCLCQRYHQVKSDLICLTLKLNKSNQIVFFSDLVKANLTLDLI